MNRIDKTLALLQASGKKMLSPYITAGDPAPRYTVELMHALVKAGADVLEIGLPFSDPMAEGLVIQAAMERALAHGVDTDLIFTMVKSFREQDDNTPIVIMGYVNPVEQYGYERFAANAKQAGVDGTILVDLPPEESADIKRIWDIYGLYGIYLCSPTTSMQRMTLINQYANGYLYYVSLKGVTGADGFDLSQVKKEYQQRRAQTTMPLMLGFGIKTATMAAQVASFADGVIVGAALISTILAADEQGQDVIAAAFSLIQDMRHTMDALR